MSRFVIGVPGSQYSSYKFESEARDAFQKAVEERAVHVLPPVSTTSSSTPVTARTAASPVHTHTQPTCSETNFKTCSCPKVERKPKPEKTVPIQKTETSSPCVYISSGESEQEEIPTHRASKPSNKRTSPAKKTPSSPEPHTARREHVKSKTPSSPSSSSPDTAITQYAMSSSSDSRHDTSTGQKPPFYRPVPNSGSPLRDSKLSPLQTSYTYPLNPAGQSKAKEAKPSTNTSPSTWTFNSEDTPIYVIDSDDGTEPETDQEVTHRPAPIQKSRPRPRDFLLSPLETPHLNMTGAPESVSVDSSSRVQAQITPKQREKKGRRSTTSSSANVSISAILDMAQTTPVTVHSPSFDPRSPFSRNIQIPGHAK